MAVYESRYKELMFYVDGKPKQFKNGKYTTTSKEEEAVLNKIPDVKKVMATKTK